MAVLMPQPANCFFIHSQDFCCTMIALPIFTVKHLIFPVSDFCGFMKMTYWCILIIYGSGYGRLPKSSNTLNIRTLKIIAKYNFKMFPKITNSG